MQSLAREPLEEGQAFGAGHGIEAVEGLVQDQDLGSVAQGQGQADPLPHPLAVGADLAIGGVHHADAAEGLVRQSVRLPRGQAVQAQPSADEGAAGDSAREGVELGAVADAPAEGDGIVGAKSQHGEASPRRADQPGQEVHERRLAGAVGPHEARDPRRQRQGHAVDAEDLAVELRDVLEDDPIVRAHDTTSRPRSRRSSSHTDSAAAAASPAQAAQVGRSPPASLNISWAIER